MLTPEIESKVNQLIDRFLSNGITNPTTVVEQISYLLFMKWLDESDKVNEMIAEREGKSFMTIFSKRVPGSGLLDIDDSYDEPQDELRWSNFKMMGAERMLDHVSKTVFPFLRGLNNKKYPFTRFMGDSVFLIPRPSLLEESIYTIDSIIDDITRDSNPVPIRSTLADVYEYLLKGLSAGSGHFRTPPHIIRMVTEIIDPDITEVVCDPVCGSGDFLVGALKHILTKYSTERNMAPEDEDGFRNGIGDNLTDKRLVEKFNNDTFYGYEFDSTLVRFCIMYLTLHGIPIPNVERIDMLSKQFDAAQGRYAVILSTPPFKSFIDKDSMGKMRIDSTKTELLFLDRIMQILQTDGRGGVIVPESVLSETGRGHKDLRKLLLETCDLKAVISMPSGVFKPYTNISTAVLVFTKMVDQVSGAISDGTDWPTQQVWFYEMSDDGYSLDDSRRPLGSKPLPALIADYRKFVDGKEISEDRQNKHFFVPIAEIIANNYGLNLKHYRTTKNKQTTYEPPKEVLDRLIRLENEILVDMKSLNDMLR